MEFYIYYRLLY